MVASVLGREFQFEALKYISPLQRNVHHTKRIEAAIKLLEQRDFIEVMDIDENKKQLCRFVHPLNCQSIYQMLRYKGCKKDLHSATVKYLQQIEPISPKASKMEVQFKTEKLLSHMLLAQNCEEEGDLMDERRTALTVQRIQNKINSNPNCIIYTDSVLKQREPSGKGLHSEVFLTLNQFELTWYESEEDAANDKFSGRVQLRYIFEVVKVTDKLGYPSICLGVSMHETSRKKEAGKQDIIFAYHAIQDRDKWTAAIDYLKTRAIYHAYAKKNKLVSLGMINECKAEHEDKTESPQVDINSLLYDFGDNFKQMTQSGGQVLPPMMQTSQSTLRGRTPTVIRPDFLRKGTMLNRRRSIQQNNYLNYDVKAPDLTSKLYLLYKVSMTSFLHHLDRSQLGDCNLVGINHTEKQEVLEGMQLPLEKKRLSTCIMREVFLQEDHQFDQQL